ncbi:MAG: AlpA family transcriptional regulator [Caulobacteraceae bacterium]|nr:AlpA family transcriptional regulator [Caulobacteraceae bacterium]
MTQTHQRLERLPAVMARTGMSRSWLYKEMAAGRFPKALKIGSASGWKASDVDQWIESLTGSPAAHSGAC